MADILIVDDDLGLQEILKRGLRKYSNSFAVLFAGNGEEAIRILEQHNIDLLVTDIKMPKVDGLALLAHLSEKHPSMPCIVLTSYTIPGIEQKLSRSILKFHRKPLRIDKLATSIMEGLEQAGRGEALSGVSVTGFAQIVEAEQKTCQLVLKKDGRLLGSLVFQDGELIDADYGDLHGEEAAVRLVGLEDVQVEFQAFPVEKTVRKIQSGLQALLLEAMRVKDEEEERRALQGDDHDKSSKLLAEGIKLAEGLHLKKAQTLLLKLLKDEPKSVEGWLWLSRTFKSKKKLKIALTRLYKLAPNSKAVEKEIRKFHSSFGKCGEKIFRCPFCYTPFDSKTVQCNFCHSYLAVNDNVLRIIGEDGDRQELQQTLERFENVLSRELNIPVLFYAGLACLNMDNFEQALQYFEQVQECVGEGEKIYANTVRRIVNYIASQQDTGEIEQVDNGTPDLPALGMDSGKKKILVVEDSPTTRKVIKMTLDTHGYLVIEAGDGVEALSKLNDERPDLILLDVMLPSLDGYGILSLLKKNSEFKKVPVIMLTSKDSFKDKIRGRFSAASAYLTKPFKPEILLKQVTKYLD
jgi:twitching motility two-component system response regulator PilG